MFSFVMELEEGQPERWADALAADMVGASQALISLIGAEVVSELRSLVEGSFRPPVRPGEPPRPAHPGGWADITGVLANSYAFQTNNTTDGAHLSITNNAQYAAYLDAMNGYFVLSGITDPGGPVETVLRRVVQQVAPEWEVRYG